MTITRLRYRDWEIVATWTPGAPSSPARAPGYHADTCPYCGSPLTHAVESGFGGHYVLETLDACPKCGWWHLAHSEDDASDNPDCDYQIMARLERFDLSGLAVPTSELIRYLSVRGEDIYSVHPRKLEEMIAAVFREHLTCRVELTKMTQDGGKDIIGFNAEHRKFLVEITRYSQAQKVGIRLIERFLGVFYKEGVNHVTIVTTRRYTQPAITVQEVPYNCGDTILLDLRDFEDVISWLQLYAPDDWAFPERELRGQISQWLFFPHVRMARELDRPEILREKI